MIYFASDMHGELTAPLLEYERIARAGDLLIILGDLGIKFEDTEENKRFTELFFSLKSDIALVDGNHENHAFINSFPREAWCGGEVHRLAPNVVHLMRGNVYLIDGKSFLAMGGCKSSPKWKEMGLYYEGEEPSEAEIALAYNNVASHKIDYILTHKFENNCDSCPDMSLEGLIRNLQGIDYHRWISGHWHREIKFNDKCFCVYDRLVSMEEIESGDAFVKG